MLTFPNVHMYPLKDGFSIDQIDNPVLQTPMNDGTVRQRQKYTTSITIMKVAYRWNANELAQVRAFHASIGAGSAEFLMKVWNYQDFVQKIVCIDKGVISVSDFLPGPPPYCIASFTLRIRNLFS